MQVAEDLSPTSSNPTETKSKEPDSTMEFVFPILGLLASTSLCVSAKGVYEAFRGNSFVEISKNALGLFGASTLILLSLTAQRVRQALQTIEDQAKRIASHKNPGLQADENKDEALVKTSYSTMKLVLPILGLLCGSFAVCAKAVSMKGIAVVVISANIATLVGLGAFIIIGIAFYQVRQAQQLIKDQAQQIEVHAESSDITLREESWMDLVERVIETTEPDIIPTNPHQQDPLQGTSPILPADQAPQPPPCPATLQATQINSTPPHQPPPSDLPPPFQQPPSDLPPSDLPPPFQQPPSDPPPIYVPPKSLPSTSSRKSLPSVPVQVEPEIQEPKEQRTKTLSLIRIVRGNSKKLYEKLFYEQNKGNIVTIAKSNLKKVPKAAFSSVKSTLSRKSSKNEEPIEAPINIDETLVKFQQEIKKLKDLKIKLKKEAIDSLQQENFFKGTLNGIIQSIEYKIEILKKTKLLNESSALHEKEEVQALIEKLKTEKVIVPKEIIESKLLDWNEKKQERTQFFKDLETKERDLTKDLGLTLSNQDGIRAKFMEGNEFRVGYENVQAASTKISVEFTIVNKEKTDAEKMAKLAILFQSPTFNEYVESIKNYFPYVTNREILDSGIDIRSLNLATTRIPLYPLLIEEAIKLTPKSAPEHASLLLTLQEVREQLRFLKSY